MAIITQTYNERSLFAFCFVIICRQSCDGFGKDVGVVAGKTNTDLIATQCTNSISSMSLSQPGRRR